MPRSIRVFILALSLFLSFGLPYIFLDIYYFENDSPHVKPGCEISYKLDSGKYSGDMLPGYYYYFACTNDGDSEEYYYPGGVIWVCQSIAGGHSCIRSNIQAYAVADRIEYLLVAILLIISAAIHFARGGRVIGVYPAILFSNSASRELLIYAMVMASANIIFS